MVANLTGAMNDTKISISGNQMFVVFKTNDDIARKGFHALIVESKYNDQNMLSESRNCIYCTGSIRGHTSIRSCTLK